MRHVRTRGQLWHKQGSKKKAVIGEFDNPDSSIEIYAHDPEFSLAHLISIGRVQPVVTAELLRHFLFSIHPMCQCAWHNMDLLGEADERTGQFAHHQCWCIRGGFSMLSILDPQHIPRILYQSMLKTSSGADERPALLTCESDGPQRSMHALVRAGWSTPQGIKWPQHGLTALLIQ